MYQGYDFYIDGYLLPITPPSLTMKIGSNNETVNLINGGDINIIKSPKLVEVTFEARFPMREYPYTKANYSFSYYFDHFKQLKENKSPFQFIVARATPNLVVTWDTNLTVALEEMEIQEDAEDLGDDVIIKFTLKQWKSYGTKTVKVKTTSGNTVTSVQQSTRPTQTTAQAEQYTIKSGDTLYAIAKKMYGDGSQWPTIYNANKSVIESAATDRGLNSSSNGHWIWAGTNLTIPSTPTGATAPSSVTWNSDNQNYTKSDGTIVAGKGATTTGPTPGSGGGRK